MELNQRMQNCYIQRRSNNGYICQELAATQKRRGYLLQEKSWKP